VSPRYIPFRIYHDVTMPRSPSVSCSDLLKFRFQTQIILLPDVCKKKSGFRNAIASGETKQSLDKIVDQKRKEKKLWEKREGRRKEECYI